MGRSGLSQELIMLTQVTSPELSSCYTSFMSVSAQVLSVISAGILSFVWVRTPALHPYSLQLIAALTLLYFGVKYSAKKKLHHILPNALSFETSMLTATLLLVVGYTGGTASLFLPLLHFLLFLSLFTLDTASLITLGLTIPFFLWAVGGGGLTSGGVGGALGNGSLSTHTIATLLSFPALLPLLLFAKTQYQERLAEKHTLQVRGDQKIDMTMFITTFLKPKLYTMFQLSSYPAENKENIQKQIRVILEQTELMIGEVKDDGDEKIGNEKK